MILWPRSNYQILWNSWPSIYHSDHISCHIAPHYYPHCYHWTIVSVHNLLLRIKTSLWWRWFCSVKKIHWFLQECRGSKAVVWKACFHFLFLISMNFSVTGKTSIVWWWTPPPNLEFCAECSQFQIPPQLISNFNESKYQTSLLSSQSYILVPIYRGYLCCSSSPNPQSHLFLEICFRSSSN